MIKANTCPYCDGPYTVNAGGCVAKCAGMATHQRMMTEALDEQEAPMYRVRITYSSGKTAELDGWTAGMIDQMRASWKQIVPASTATIEILGLDLEYREP